MAFSEKLRHRRRDAEMVPRKCRFFSVFSSFTKVHVCKGTDWIVLDLCYTDFTYPYKSISKDRSSFVCSVSCLKHSSAAPLSVVNRITSWQPFWFEGGFLHGLSMSVLKTNYISDLRMESSCRVSYWLFFICSVVKIINNVGWTWNRSRRQHQSCLPIQATERFRGKSWIKIYRKIPLWHRRKLYFNWGKC